MISDSGLGVEYTAGDDFYDWILRDLYRDVIADTVINPNTLLKRITRSRMNVHGKEVVFPTHIGRNNGISAIGVGGRLPDAGSQEYAQFRFGIAHIFGRVKLDGTTLDAAVSSETSWARAIDSEVAGMSRDFARFRQRVFHGNGSGILARSKASVAITNPLSSFQVNMPTELPLMTLLGSPQANGGTWLRPGMRIGFRNETNGVIEAVATITSIGPGTNDPFDKVVAFTPGFNHATAGFIQVIAYGTDDGVGGADVLLDGGYLREPMGIAGIVDDNDPPTGSFQGVDSDDAANFWHRANVIDVSNAGTAVALTLAHLDTAYSRTVEIGDVLPDIGVGTFGVVRAYGALVIQERRYVNTEVYDGGYGGLVYNGMPIIADRDCPGNRLYFLYTPDFTVNVMAEPQWWDKDGKIWRVASNDREAIQATYYTRENLSSNVRDVHTLLIGFITT